jgi:glutamate-1-semialdehyde 2,1-aminomutase
MGPIEAKFRKRTPKSAELSDRASKVMPGGETRSAAYHPPYSVVVDHGVGSRVFDVDGNDYLDVSNNYTCLVHGHAYPPVIDAVGYAIQKGTTWAAKAIPQIELAELIVDRVASVDEVKYANSGAEAVQYALLLARGFNGRSKILVSSYSYHGHFVDPNAYSGMTLADNKGSNFVNTYIAEWNNAESFEAILEDHGHEIAAVLLEPWLGAGGMVAATPEFFTRVHAAARAAGALFILDEATVFRLSTGGAQALLGIDPDITVLGKIIGGGFPGGGIGGKREFMELGNPSTGTVHISGTFSGNPITTTAGYVTIRDLTAERIDKMTGQMETIEEAMRKSAARHGVPFSSRRIGSLMNVWFSEQLPAANHVRQDDTLATRFHLACMTNGIFGVPRTLMNVTTATSDDDVIEIVQRLDAALEDVASEM